MLENDIFFPNIDNIKDHEKIFDIYWRIKIGKKLLQPWNISF